MDFPRLLYRGEPDTLGVSCPGSETTRVDSQDDFDAALAEGWRLTREPAIAPALTHAADTHAAPPEHAAPAHAPHKKRHA